MGECVKLEAQLPNKLRALVNRDPVPEKSVCVRFRFVLTQPKDAHFGTRSCRLTGLSIQGPSAHWVRIPRHLDRFDWRHFHWVMPKDGIPFRVSWASFGPVRCTIRRRHRDPNLASLLALAPAGFVIAFWSLFLM
jgi:hypothetical protein